MARRNNQDRLKAPGPTPDASPAAFVEAENSAQPQKGGLLSFVAPTEFVELPSRGKFYSKDHPLHNKDVVEIRFMTAKHEDILSSPTLLRKGIAVDRLLADLVVDKSINVDSLLIGDKNAVTIAARKTGYGSDYTIGVTCPACFTNVKHKFDLDKLENNFPEKEDLKDLNITLTKNNTFMIDLPVTKVKVELKLLTGQDDKALDNYRKMMKKHSGVEIGLSDQIKQMIASANGEEDSNLIGQFVDNMPAMDSKFIRACYAAVMPNVSMKQDFKCPACDHDEEVDIPLTAEFFWPR